MSRKKRRKDHYWSFVKFDGNEAIYAVCSCGFCYLCYKSAQPPRVLPLEPDPDKLYPYCPLCGARKIKYYPEVKKIKEEKP